MLKASPVFQKQVLVTAEKVNSIQQVITLVNNSYVEAENTAYPGDWIVTNPGGEKYILSEITFKARYDSTEKEGVYRAKGKIKAVLNPYKKDITIIAPWGKEQHGAADCYVAALFDEEDIISTHRYLIEHEAFHQTYSEKVD